MAFWCELLTSDWQDYKRLPLLLWFAGLVQHAAGELQATDDELVPSFFRAVQAAGRSLPVGWRPAVPLSLEKAKELQALSRMASESYRQQMEELHFKELHAKQVGNRPRGPGFERELEGFRALSARFQVEMQHLNRCPRRWTARRLSSLTP